MKKIFISEIVANSYSTVDLYCWVKQARHQGSIIFLDLIDSTGTLQVVASRKEVDIKTFEIALSVGSDDALLVKLVFVNDEYHLNDIKIIAASTLNLLPNPRSDFDIFNNKYTDHILRNRTHYIKNSKQAALLSFKSKFIYEIHNYFQKENYTFVDAPVLTEMLLYEDSSAFSIKYGENDKYTAWLSQCNTFQLEPAILAFEKVYNVTPSFRAEHSRSDRHACEYYHLKAEIAWAKLEDIVKTAEEAIYTISMNTYKKSERELKILGLSYKELRLELLVPPFKAIEYDEAVGILNQHNRNFEWGKSLSTEDETFLTEHFGNKFLWIKYIPASAEGFPFSLHAQNNLLTMTQDLIAPFGFAEIIGTAEKITDKEMLYHRMEEKGKTSPDQLERYKSYIELRDSGLPFHGGLGMGLDRVVRYLTRANHIKDVFSFPRLYRRRWQP